jgi:FkbM family methyltransferase
VEQQTFNPWVVGSIPMGPTKKIVGAGIVKRDSRFKFRVLMFLRHPIKIINFLLSGQNDYSKIQLQELKKYLSNPSVIIEAGAADGADTILFAAEFPQADIFAIEPVNEQFAHLKNLCAKNNNIKLFNFAFSEQNGESEIIIGNSEGILGGMGSSSILEPLEHEKYFPKISFDRKQKVSTKTLYSFMSENKIMLVDLLWLDIQGKEFDVLKASQQVVKDQVKLIHLEISRIQFYSDMPKEKEIRKFMKDLGFICVIDKIGAISGNALFLNSKFNFVN